MYKFHRIILVCFAFLMTQFVIGQDLPNPIPNNVTLSQGSYVIAMDNNNQTGSSGTFNLKAYGLVVYLLNNNVPVKWVILTGKVKDGIDFSVNATRIKPSAGTPANFDFRAGPFVIQAANISGVSALIDAYNNTISNSADKVKVYQTNAAVTVDQRYDLAGFKPKAILLNNGGNFKIHRQYMIHAGITFGMNSTQTQAINWNLGIAQDLPGSCYTFASEAHWKARTASEASAVLTNIRSFLNAGGNVLAECAAVRTYENAGRFHSTGGINVNTENDFSGSSSWVVYPNADLSYSQFNGAVSINKGGSLKNWTYSGSLVNNEHDHALGSGNNSNIGASAAKFRTSGTGGMLYYLGNHNYDGTTQLDVLNGIRMYLNAFLTPSANNNVICTPLPEGHGGEQCFLSPTKPGTVNARINWSYSATNQTYTIKTTFAKTFVDNTYGTGSIGWSGGHTFNDLVGSDHVQLALYDANGTKKMEFKLDYMSASASAPSGYKSLGVTGGDGGMIVGSSSDVLGAKTSLDVNFNEEGYVLTTNSPATNSSYSINSTYPNWIYDVWYEVTVKASAFGSVGFGTPIITDVHASPSKTGNNTEAVTPGDCPGNTKLGNMIWNDANNDGIKQSTETGLSGVTVKLYTDLNGDNIVDGAAIRTTITDASGYYSFEDLVDCKYIIGVVKPSGFGKAATSSTSINPDNDVDNDNNGIYEVNGEIRTNHITIIAETEPINDGDDEQGNLTMDIGLLGTCGLGDFVWLDRNNNGLQDTGEPGISGATINLYTDDNKDNIPDGPAIATMYSSNSGYYNFSAVLGKNYIIGVVIPSGFVKGVTTSTSNDPNNSTANDNNGVNLTLNEVFTNSIAVTTNNNRIDIALAADCSCVNSGTNPLVNASFENGNTGWTVTGGSITTGSSYAMCGSVNGFLNQSSGNAIMYQDVAVNEGANVTMSAYAGTHTPGISCNPRLSLIFLNASNTVLAQSNVTVTKDVDIYGAVLGYYTLAAIAPVGTTKVRVQASISCNNLKIDGFCLSIQNPCPTDISAGSDQSKCATNTFITFADAAPFNSTGTWSVVSGSATISNVNASTTNVTITTPSATLRWTISRAGCANISDTVRLTNSSVTVAYAGPNQSINNTATTMAANTPGLGETANWSIVSQPSGSPLVTYSDINSPTTVVRNMNSSGTYTFRWTITKGGCISTSNVSITVNTPCLRGSETWPNTWVNNFVTNLTNSPVSGSSGSWSLTTNNNAAFAILSPYYSPSTTNALKIVNWRTDGVSPGKTPAGAGYASACSPVIDLSNPCCPTGHVMQFTLWSYNVVNGDNNAWMSIDFSNDNGTTWYTAFRKTSDQIFDDYGANTVKTVTLPVGINFNVNNFRYRIVGESRVNNPNNFLMFIDDILFLSPSVCNVLTLGNQVWYDQNNDGLKGTNEPGIEGVSVDLYNALGNLIETTTTDANGNYRFNNLSAGNYSVGAIIPSGYNMGDYGNTSIITDNENDAVTVVEGEARTNLFSLSASSNNIDIAFKGTLNLGNFVWKDDNLNGLKEDGENGLNGVIVNLYYDSNKDNIPDGNSIGTMITNGGGFYGFGELAPGNYIVGVTFPTKYSSSGITLSSFSPNNNIDNDNNGINLVPGGFRSNYITLSAFGEPVVDGDGPNGNLTLDFALIPDNDNDGSCDCIDIDDDNDGITDVNESGGYDPLADCDNDGLKNYQDPTPGCETPSGNDPWGVSYKPLIWTDCNGDGVNDFFDWDRDGVINELDLDSDNDGIVDSRESRDNKYLDADMNGQIDGTDPDHNGLLSSAENGSSNPVLNGLQAQDLDKDGTPNFLDLDSDGDGVTDIRESFLVDMNDDIAFINATNQGITTGNDTDNDGVRNEVFSGSTTVITSDAIAGLGAKGIVPQDTDGDGFPDAYDIDSDNDGISDHVEAQPTCSYVLPCVTDNDGDGLQDCIETSTIANCFRRNGAGVTPADKDNDGSPDYLDLDTDNDGKPDINEGTGISGNYINNYEDNDRDGMYDQWDVFNIAFATGNFINNVGHNQMGPGGNYDGLVPSGSNAQLPQTATGSCPMVDRDWRNVSVLPVSVISFDGSLNGSIAKLIWKTVQEQNMRQYEVERSIDGVSFEKVGVVVSLNVQGQYQYNFSNEINNLTASKIYYRLRIIDRNSVTRFSNVISFVIKNNTDVSIKPNPANTHCVVSFTSNKNQIVPVIITDIRGKLVRNTMVNLSKGLNNITIKELGSLSSGTYIIRILAEQANLTGQLVIQH